jgi:3-keto-5-aminohexanoate cleavage enzyme
VDPLIITVAGIGAEVTRAQQPALPITAEEIGADAARCEEAGASMYHLHVRDPDGKATMEVTRFRAARDAIAAGSDIIVQFTSGGAAGDPEDHRIAPLELRPDMASLTTGTVNFGNAVFLNPLPLVVRFYKRMRELGIMPEFEIFEPGMLATAERVYRIYGDGHHRHYDFVLDVPGGMPAWEDSVAFLASHLPSGATWSATGIGRSYVDVAQKAIEMGGHVRTGFEDVRFYAPGRIAASNAELVERIVAIAHAEGREVASPRQARELLGLEAKRGTLSS